MGSSRWTSPSGRAGEVHRHGLTPKGARSVEIGRPSTSCGQRGSPADRLSYGRRMARHVIDRNGVAGVATSLDADPHTLHALAAQLSGAAVAAEQSVAGDCPALRQQLDRFRLLHCRGLDVVAEATAALSGDLFTVANQSQALERAISQAYVTRSHRSGAVP